MIEVTRVRDGIFIVAIHIDGRDRVFVAVALTAKGATRKLLKTIEKFHEEKR